MAAGSRRGKGSTRSSDIRATEVRRLRQARSVRTPRRVGGARRGRQSDDTGRDPHRPTRTPPQATPAPGPAGHGRADPGRERRRPHPRGGAGRAGHRHGSRPPPTRSHQRLAPLPTPGHPSENPGIPSAEPVLPQTSGRQGVSSPSHHPGAATPHPRTPVARTGRGADPPAAVLTTATTPADDRAATTPADDFRPAPTGTGRRRRPGPLPAPAQSLPGRLSRRVTRTRSRCGG